MAVRPFGRGRRETEGGVTDFFGGWCTLESYRLQAPEQVSRLFHDNSPLNSTQGTTRSFRVRSGEACSPVQVATREVSMRGQQGRPSLARFEWNSSVSTGVPPCYGKEIASPSSRIDIFWTSADGVFWETNRTAPSHMTNCVPPG